MGTLVLTDAKVLAGSYDFSGDHNQIGLDYGADSKDATTFGQGTRIHKGGLKVPAFSAGGFVDLADDDVDEQYFTSVGLADVPLSVMAVGTEGEVAFSLKSLLTQYQPGAEVGELLAFQITADPSGGAPLVRGTLMHGATRTATANGTARQLGAVAAGKKVYGILHVTAASGTTPTLDAKVQSDDASGFPSATDRITFTQATGITSQWAELAGPITDDWWRVAWTIGGTTPSFTFWVILGIQ